MHGNSMNEEIWHKIRNDYDENLCMHTYTIIMNTS